MPVHEILLVRHANRVGWTLNPVTGAYTSTIPYPTGLPADPPLTSSGVGQSHELGTYLSKLLQPSTTQPRSLRIYSSPFYRCLETLRPTVEKLIEGKWDGKVRVRKGFGEWFGKATWKQPVPERVSRLREGWFPWLEENQERQGSDGEVVPGAKGETIEELHDRMGRAFEEIFAEVDRESGADEAEKVTVLICGHAAGVIAAGRVLTGEMPRDWAEKDFKCFTAGVSRFIRKSEGAEGAEGVKGGLGEWSCVANSGCEHLSLGEERGWGFQGEESFDSMATVEKDKDRENGDRKGEEGSKL